ncbi:hypothetical protein VE01_03642 [Pseudogymnoascus verrucosus]|uniref:AB hydrolase-1 domain-containing protein n=1 Tax=Pseudogymnoascus verrucosus TaxID=342668 RepID=A0A1B8GS19_9PEZI|nr:uncharacterized protein VE01_03642 [Pseudogymnoascus verrucosus]OBT98600.1 hypothetical protein VE01_03642 [Pseudogymnoascus verrucosus]
MVLKPTLSLTLPSLKDETVLDCRVYFPTTLYDPAASTDSSSGSWSGDDEKQRERERTRSQLNGEARASDSHRWTGKRKKAAIIAHPYAPLGGSCDDYIVQQTAGILLKQGFVVGLFNFRGAATSKGKTSWNGKPEVCDYHSMVGFMAAFMHHLDLEPVSPTSSLTDAGTYELSTIPSQLPANPVSARPTTSSSASTNRDSAAVDNTPLLLLAGYSYGSLITTMLPPLPALLTPFQSPLPGTPASEIRLRAQHLAEEQNTLHTERLKRASEAATRRQHARNVSGGLRVGGDETSDVHHRTSLDSHHARRSLRLDRLEHSDWGRRSVERVRSLRKSLDGHRFSPPPSPSRHTSQTERRTNSSSATIDTPGGASVVVSPEEASEAVAATAAATPMPLLQFGEMDAVYLLISPIQGVVGGLATMFTTTSAKSLLPSLSFRKKDAHASTAALNGGDGKFVENKTLVVFGNKDSFSNADRMRRWTQKLEGARGSRFRAVEVNNGGHFWHEMEELEVLKRSVERWARELG